MNIKKNVNINYQKYKFEIINHNSKVQKMLNENESNYISLVKLN